VQLNKPVSLVMTNLNSLSYFSRACICQIVKWPKYPRVPGDKVNQLLFSDYSGFLHHQKTDRHDITEILLKVALNTTTLIITHNETIIIPVCMNYLWMVIIVEWSFMYLWNDRSCICGMIVHVFVEWSFMYLWNDRSCISNMKAFFSFDFFMVYIPECTQ
jgi:hypothetical protein